MSRDQYDETYDSVAKAQVIVDDFEKSIHEGTHYFIGGFDDLGNTDTVVFAMKTPDSEVRIHTKFVVQGIDDTEVELYEGASAISGGAEVTPRNSDRNAGDNSKVTVLKDPTVGDNGTLLSEFRGGNSTNQANDDFVRDRNQKIILKKNTWYLFKITSHADGNRVTYVADWCECDTK